MSSTAIPAEGLVPQLTFFYDGQCPLCMKEIRLLNNWNTAKAVEFVDLTSVSVLKDYPAINVDDALRTLLALRPDGTPLRGVDATFAVWSVLGRGHWVAPLGWRWLRPVTTIAYRFFARYRHQFALILTGQSRCVACELESPSPSPHVTGIEMKSIAGRSTAAETNEKYSSEKNSP